MKYKKFVCFWIFINSSVKLYAESPSAFPEGLFVKVYSGTRNPFSTNRCSIKSKISSEAASTV